MVIKDKKSAQLSEANGEMRMSEDHQKLLVNVKQSHSSLLNDSLAKGPVRGRQGQSINKEDPSFFLKKIYSDGKEDENAV